MKHIFLLTDYSSKYKKTQENNCDKNILANDFKKLLTLALNKKNITPILDFTFKQKCLLYLNYFQNKKNIILHIQWNESTKKISGTEASIPGKKNITDISILEAKIAGEILRIMSNVLAIKNRGVKLEKDNFYKSLNKILYKHDNIIIKLGFITNQYDIQQYNNYKFLLAEAVADYIQSIC